MTECTHCGQEIPVEDLRVSIHGMYDMHLFTSYKSSTVDGIIHEWRHENATRPHPAIVGNREVDDLGEVCLCPATVLAFNPLTKKEITLRRVGSMVFPDRKDTEKQLSQWREALLADPDITELLRKQYE